MPKKSFALEVGGPERLGVSWRGAFKDVAVSLDGLPVATFADPKELKQPQAVVLPDGSRLEVQVASVFVLPELRLLRDGEPIPGSASDPAARHAGAWQMVLAVAVLNVAIGLLVELFDVAFLRGIGVGWASVVAGLTYGALAFFVRRRSIVALGLAVGLFVLDGIFGMVAAAQASGALRFLAHKCQIDDAGLHVTLPSGQQREVPWTDVGRVVVRQLPPDPPWDSGVILDLIAFVGGRWEPVRVFGTTLVNYTALAGGASPATCASATPR